MNINFVKVRKDSLQTPLTNESYMEHRIGFWACVVDVHSDKNTVDVLSDTGFKLVDIPVISKQWICIDNNKDFTPASRNLPQINSRVFILMPTGTIDGSFVLCSGYSNGDTTSHGLWAEKQQSDISKKNNIEESISQSGWNKKEYYRDGNIIFVSLDENVKLEIILVDNSQDSLVKGISVKAWNNSIVVNEEGISFEDKNSNKISTSNNGISLIDKNNNKITTNNSGLVIQDKNNNKIESTTTSLKLNGNLEVLQ